MSATATPSLSRRAERRLSEDPATAVTGIELAWSPEGAPCGCRCGDIIPPIALSPKRTMPLSLQFTAEHQPALQHYRCGILKFGSDAESYMLNVQNDYMANGGLQHLCCIAAYNMAESRR